ncbi:MAG: hypothetical protein RR318_00130 [Alistipes sp.]
MLLVAGLCAVSCGSDDDPKDNGKPVPPDPGIRDIRIEAKYALGGYIQDVLEDGTDLITVPLSTVSMTGSASNPVTAGKAEVVYMQLLADMGDSGRLPDGTYNTVMAAEDGSNLVANVCIGSFVKTQANGQPDPNAMINMAEGKVTVKRSGTTYTIVVDVTLTDSQTLYCTFTGKIAFEKINTGFSTLTEDKVVNLVGNPGDGIFSGQLYASQGIVANVWDIGIIKSEEDRPNSEAMLISLFAPSTGTFAEGIPTGTYAVTNDPMKYKDGEKVCIPGDLSEKGEMYFTWYAGITDKGIEDFAPATAGQVTIAKAGENYTVTFEFKDDRDPAHTFSGTWTGSITMEDNTKNPASVRSTIAKVSYNKVSNFLNVIR